MVWQILLGFLTALILMGTVFKSKYKGDIGEMVIMVKLKELNRAKYVKLHDIKLANPSSNTKTSQIDHLVVSTYGIFCIETKAYKGKIYGKEFSHEWTQYLSNGSHKFLNPLFQNYGHIIAVQNVVDNYYPDMPYFSIVAFSGEADIKNIEVEKSVVCKMARIADVVRSLSNEEVISEEELLNLVKIIEKNKTFQTDYGHKRDIKKLKKANAEKISQNICPKCGGELVERNGKYGAFTGCSNFPKCRFVVNSKK